MLVINAFETIGLQLVQCVLYPYCPHSIKQGVMLICADQICTFAHQTLTAKFKFVIQSITIRCSFCDNNLIGVKHVMASLEICGN